MYKSLMLMLVVFMVAKNGIAQEAQANAKEAEKAPTVVEEANDKEHGKTLKLKELIEAKEYHYHDGWVEHLDAH